MRGSRDVAAGGHALIRGGADPLGLMLSALIMLCLLLFAASLGVLFIMPVNTYWRASGTVVYRSEQKLVADFDGIVSDILAGEGSDVQKGAPILIYRNRDYLNQARLLEIRLLSEKASLTKLKDLHKLGYLDPRSLTEKEGEVRQMEQSLAELLDCTFNSFFGGSIRFAIPPGKMVGSFVRKGETLGSIVSDSAKTVEVMLHMEFADKIQEGAVVNVMYKSVTDYISHRIIARVTRRHLDMEGRRLLLTCDPDSSVKNDVRISEISAGSLVDARILIKKASMLERFFQGAQLRDSSPWSDLLPDRVKAFISE